MKTTHWLISGAIALALGTAAGSAQAAPFVFDFTGKCDDCAALDPDADLDFNTNLDDGAYQDVTGRLVLDEDSDLLFFTKEELIKKKKQAQKEANKKKKQKVPQKKPKVQVSAFYYDGSNLLPATPLVFGDSSGTKKLKSIVSGKIATDGTIIEALSIRVGKSIFFADTDGSWWITNGRFLPPPSDDGDEAQEAVHDVGVQAQFTSVDVPAPGALALFGFGLIGLAARRRAG